MNEPHGESIVIKTSTPADGGEWGADVAKLPSIDDAEVASPSMFVVSRSATQLEMSCKPVQGLAHGDVQLVADINAARDGHARPLVKNVGRRHSVINHSFTLSQLAMERLPASQHLIQQ